MAVIPLGHMSRVSEFTATAFLWKIPLESFYLENQENEVEKTG
jgi:hypothetical protein